MEGSCGEKEVDEGLCTDLQNASKDHSTRDGQSLDHENGGAWILAYSTSICSGPTFQTSHHYSPSREIPYFLPDERRSCWLYGFFRKGQIRIADYSQCDLKYQCCQLLLYKSYDSDAGTGQPLKS